MFKKISKDNGFSGFTIVELLVVIVIIGILASITAISYTGITKKATTAVLQSDASNASEQLEIFKIANGSYPSTADCSSADSNTNLCLKTSSGTAFTYQVPDSNSPKSYTLYAANAANSQIVMKSNQSTINAVSKICPTNFVLVPGSSTYGTSDFCVMKYEARIQGSDIGYVPYSSSFIADSRPTGDQWTMINQIEAKAAAATACSGCHLITSAEWMTIAQNVASVASNWSSATVGSGYIYSGYLGSDWLDASSDDNDGYYGTSYYQFPNSRTTSDYQQRRTLTLTNGQTIWDFSGSMEEWNNETTTGITEFTYSEWPNVSTAIIDALTSQLGVNPSPAGTGITGSGNWKTDNRTGLMSLYNGTNGILRGYSGIFGFHSMNAESNGSTLSFRSAK